MISRHLARLSGASFVLKGQWRSLSLSPLLRRARYLVEDSFYFNKSEQHFLFGP
jgi:hypothetical protein